MKIRLPRWKKEQRQRKERKRFRLARNIFLLICLIFFFGVGHQVWGSLKKSLWDGKSRLTMVLNLSPILIASFDPNDETLNCLAIPENTYLETIHGYGFYKAGSVWELGELEGYGGEFLAGSLQEYLGIPVDGWMAVPNGDFAILKTEKNGQIISAAGNTEIKKKFLTYLVDLIRFNGGTNLTKWDILRLWWGIKGVRFDKINLVDLDQTNAARKITLADGESVLEINPLFLDQFVAKSFSDRKIKNEGFSIGVYNATQHPGLAKKAARIIDNIGGQVIEVGDWDEKTQNSKLKTQNSNFKKYTARKLMKIFNCQYSDSEIEKSQAEIVVILGEDYWQKLTEK